MMNIERFYIFDFQGVLESRGGELVEALVDELLDLPNVHLAIVSNYPTKTIKRALKKTGLKFTHILGIEKGLSKAERIKYICYDWAIDPTDAYFFTDTVADILAVREIMDESKIYGCTWGFDGEERLLELLPADNILKIPSDIQKIEVKKVDIKKISAKDFSGLIFSPAVIGKFFDMSVVLVGPVLIGLFTGSYLDKLWQSTPWCLFSLTILGFFVSIVLVIKEIKRFSEDEKRHDTTGNK